MRESLVANHDQLLHIQVQSDCFEECFRTDVNMVSIDAGHQEKRVDPLVAVGKECMPHAYPV